MNAPHHQFGLCLMVNHACNLRCSYCYAGAKFSSPMPWETGVAAIRRAFRSLLPDGRLDLGFFGGEPLLEHARIADWMQNARNMALESGKRVGFSLTTNGTIAHEDAWQIMMAEDLDVAVSFDGGPDIHDRHRRDAKGNGTASHVEAMVRRLVQSGKPFRVVAVVRPDTLAEVPDGLRHIHDLGVLAVDLSLDLWTTWTASDALRLQIMIQRAAELWREWLPEFSLNWFDAKVGQLAQLPVSEESTRCGFGTAEIAVAPSGRLYPCERLIGEDRPDHPLRLPGNALEGDDFLASAPAAFDPCAACSKCLLTSACDTTCRCSNFVRTGDVNRPDGLLCILNNASAEAVSRVLEASAPLDPFKQANLQNERPNYVR